MIPHQIRYKNSTVNLYELDFPNAIGQEVGSRQQVIITDTNVHKLFPEDLSIPNIITIGPGESNKTLDTVNHVYSRLMEMEIGRDAVLTGFGGGVVCDITGFVASTYKRGLKFGFVPTTLLAQVDAAIGGKNGVNHNNIKNAIGLVRQPDFIIFEYEYLKTLSASELKSGFAEVIKTSLIGSRNLFGFIEDSYDKALSLNTEILQSIIAGCVNIKAEITTKDEFDSGPRRVLNFGHTFGHAIEAIGGLPHGQAVSVGMVMALELSRLYCDFPESSFAQAKELLERFELPVEYKYDTDEVMSKLIHDKKIKGNKINFVLLEEIGRPVIKKIPVDSLTEFLNNR